MGAFSIWHLLLVAGVFLLLFGGGGNKISNIMGDFAKGIKAFKKGMKDEEVEPPPPASPKTIDSASPVNVRPTGGKVIEGNTIRLDDAVRG